ncbi:uncharacterized protein CBL_02108 [Carabus blaptoides fortunei]
MWASGPGQWPPLFTYSTVSTASNSSSGACVQNSLSRFFRLPTTDNSHTSLASNNLVCQRTISSMCKCFSLQLSKAETKHSVNGNCLINKDVRHGRLIVPPSRASAWRYGFSTPPDYNDHELYCGGFTRQWTRNDGKCGVCGDAWDTPTPRAHELGGTYGQGVIVRRYRPRTWISIRVELTANHNGHFEFRLCPNYRNTTQDCLDKYVLRLARMKSEEGMDPLGYRYFPRDGNKIYEIKYRLPDLSCSHCVLQWIYIAGNNWGTCPNGTGAVGCGPQEEFRACADIAIGSSSTDVDTTLTPDLTTTPADVETPVPEDTYHQLYSYYYQVGRTVKQWLKGGQRSKEQPQVPVPPPRARKTRAPPPPYDGRMYNVSLDRESMA